MVNYKRQKENETYICKQKYYTNSKICGRGFGGYLNIRRSSMGVLANNNFFGFRVPWERSQIQFETLLPLPRPPTRFVKRIAIMEVSKDHIVTLLDNGLFGSAQMLVSQYIGFFECSSSSMNTSCSFFLNVHLSI